MHALTIHIFRTVRRTLSPEAARELLLSERPSSLDAWTEALSRYMPHTIARTLLLGAVADWCVAQTNAEQVLQTLAEVDHRLVVWAACACAETTLKYVPKEESHLRIALELGRDWVRGKATPEQCIEAGLELDKVGPEEHPQMEFSVYPLYYAVRAIAFAVSGVCYPTDAEYVPEAAAFAANPRSETLGLRALCKTIHDAVLTLPTAREE